MVLIQFVSPVMLRRLLQVITGTSNEIELLTRKVPYDGEKITNLIFQNT